MTEQVTPLPGPGPEAGYRLVREASDVYRRTSNRVALLRKKLQAAERQNEDAKRQLRLAIKAVQPILPEELEVEPRSQDSLPL